MSMKRRLKITVSGVRGIVGETFSPILAADFASAFGEFVGKGPVIVGRDTRTSGELFEQAVAAGLMAVGCQVILAGIIPTPTLQIAVKLLEAAGGIAITASHNNVEWNALKFIGSDAFFIDGNSGAELLDIYNQPDADYVMESSFRSVKNIDHAFRLHQELILGVIDTEAIRKARLKVAADCCNGVGSLYTRNFLEALGVEVIALFDDPAKAFERPPEPIPKHLSALSDAVKKNSCDIGFAQDPDGDRISLVAETGELLGVQNSLLPLVEHMLERSGGNGTIVANIQTTRAVELLAKKYNSSVIYAPVGEVNVTNAMNENQALFGLEGSSGGFLAPMVHPCRDSFMAMALVLEMMAKRKRTVSAIMEQIPHYYSADAKIECSAQHAVDALRELAAKYAYLNPVTVDGVRIDFGDSWILARPSNTEAVVRILAEAPTLKQAQTLARNFAEELTL